MEKSEKKKILFLCTGNSVRSQMAEGLMRHFRGDEFEVYSAGVELKGVNSLAIEVMREIGIDISHQRSKHLDEYREERFDYIVTLCDHAATTCPLFPGEGKIMHQGFSDPVKISGTGEEKKAEFRRIRDELKRFIYTIGA
jgi:arsenate reductase